MKYLDEGAFRVAMDLTAAGRARWDAIFPPSRRKGTPKPPKPPESATRRKGTAVTPTRSRTGGGR